jgi:hypothetical protein
LRTALESRDMLDAAARPVMAVAGVNGPESRICDWDQVDWDGVEGDVRRLRQRISTGW